MKQRSLTTTILLNCLFPAALLSSDADFASRRLDNWHQWRGPDASGVAPRGNPPVELGEGKNVRWKIDVPGEGHASPIVWGDRVFVLAAVRTERQRAAPPPADPRAKTTPPQHVYRFQVLCVDLHTGKVLWERTACEDAPHEGRHETNSYASGSPTTDGQLLFAPFGSRGVYCYTLDGELKWKRDLGRMRTRLGWGEGTSPAVHDGTLVVNWDQEEGSFIVALDARTGEPRWRKDRDEPTSWATPLIVEHAGRIQAIVNATNRVRSYDLRTGEVIWECGGQTVNAIPSPVAADGFTIAMSGYRGAAAIAIPLDSKGDVTGKETLRWTLGRGTPYVPSPILIDDRVYFTQTNSAILTCVEARTGKPLIERQRLPGLQNLYASPVGAAGRIYFFERDGTALVIKSSDRLEVLATGKLDDAVDASPAIAGTKMLVRSKRHLYCLEAASAAGSAAKQ
jgi:outer membrane protein assembly factor BamB